MLDTNLTPLQRKAIEAVRGRMHQYLDARMHQVIRVNPKLEPIWEDVAWQQMNNLRLRLSGDKAYGPIRYQVAETLVSDDEKKIYDLFSYKSQYCLMGEIVEEKESDTQRTRGILEIHDNRTMFRAIDPTIESLIVLVQTFMWWDLEDASLLAKFDMKADRVHHFRERGVTDDIKGYYANVMNRPENPPTQDEIIHYELDQLEKTLAAFRTRRTGEAAHLMIIKRDVQVTEDPDLLIEAIASQMTLLKTLERGGALDAGLTDQFAKAMHLEPAAVTAEKAKQFLATTIQNNKKRLRKSLTGGGTGEPYNMKAKQLDELQDRLKTLKGEEAPVV